jgi:hypothetical protein
VPLFPWGHLFPSSVPHMYIPKEEYSFAIHVLSFVP